ncbi:MAG: PAS domain S-box protein [Cytophagaceae bacterium]
MQNSGIPVDNFFYKSKRLMFILDSTFLLLKINPAFAEFLGRDLQAETYPDIIGLIHPEEKESFRILLNNSFVKDAPEGGSPGFRILNASGRYVRLADINSFVHEKHLYLSAAAGAEDQQIGEKRIFEPTHILNEVISLVPHPIFLKDGQGKYLLVNQAQSELFSISSGELLGKDDRELIKDKEQYKGVAESDAAVLQRHETVDIAEQIITTPDGERKILHTTKVPLFSPTDAQVYILGVSVDLTDLKKYQEALKQNEEKYRSLVELSPDAIIILKNGKIAFINNSGIKLLGAGSADELTGRRFMDFIHPDYYTLIIERNKVLKKGERVAAIQEKFIRTDGNSIDVEVSSIPFLYEDQFSIQIIARDITDRVKAQNTRHKRKQEFQALAENSSDIIARFNKNYEHLYINNSVFRYTGKTPDYFINRKVSEDYPKSLYRNVEKVIDKVFKKGKTVTRYFILPTSQGIQYCFATLVPERNKENEIVSVLATVRDITDLKLKERELISINKELNTFIYKASHDLKGPLSTILGLSRLSTYSAEMDYKELFTLIHKIASDLNHTLKKLLEIVQIKEGSLKIVSIDLPKLLAGIISGLEKEFNTGSIKFSVSLGGLDIIRSDYEILSSMIRNLVRNSIQYKGDHEPHIIIRAESAGDDITISVEDNGQGI